MEMVLKNIFLFKCIFRYGQLCEVLLEEDYITAEKFAIDFLPELLKYQSDSIVNVKLTLSRTLTRAVMVTGECWSWILCNIKQRHLIYQQSIVLCLFVSLRVRLDYFCRPECKDSERVLEAIEKLQSDGDRDVRYFAGRDEEVPYEGWRSSADHIHILRTTSRESLEDCQDIFGRSPLDGEFAEEQIEAKLLAVETTEDEEETINGFHVQSSSEEMIVEVSGVVVEEKTQEQPDVKLIENEHVDIPVQEVESDAGDNVTMINWSIIGLLWKLM